MVDQLPFAYCSSRKQPFLGKSIYVLNGRFHVFIHTKTEMLILVERWVELGLFLACPISIQERRVGNSVIPVCFKSRVGFFFFFGHKAKAYPMLD